MSSEYDPQAVALIAFPGLHDSLDVYWAWVPAQDESAAAHLDAVLDRPEEIH